MLWGGCGGWGWEGEAELAFKLCKFRLNLAVPLISAIYQPIIKFFW